MKVIEQGTGQQGWAKQAVCTGNGNGGGGCGAKLLVEERDLYKTYSSDRPGYETHVTFSCVSCRVETDLEMKDVPSHILHRLPNKPGAHGPWG